MTALTFTHGELDKTNAQIYDDHWQGVLQFERVEAKRVENGVSGCTVPPLGQASAHFVATTAAEGWTAGFSDISTA